MSKYNKAHYELVYDYKVVLSEMSEYKTRKELISAFIEKYLNNSEKIKLIRKEYNSYHGNYDIVVYFANGFIERFYNIKY